jgi:hypothetical protein
MEIFTVLRECDMDLDATVNRLLAVGTQLVDDRWKLGSPARGCSSQAKGKALVIKGIAEPSPALDKAPLVDPVENFPPIRDANVMLGVISHPGLVFRMGDYGSCSSSSRRPWSIEQGDFISQGMYKIAKREEQEWRRKQAEEIKALLLQSPQPKEMRKGIEYPHVSCVGDDFDLIS